MNDFISAQTIVASTTFTDIIKVVEILKWPFLVLVVVLLIRKPIVDFINRITKIGYGNNTLEANQQIIQKIQEKEISKIDRVIALFRSETIDSFKSAIENETELSNLSNEKERTERLLNYSCILYIMRHYDDIYNLIFGSQIRILEKLNTLRKETRETLKCFYDYAKKSNPTFFETYSYEEYLNFLFCFNLIREDNGILSITIGGVDFLKYMTESNKDVNKLN